MRIVHQWRGHGPFGTFFIIQLYTLFFAHIAKELGWILSMFVAGGATLGLAVALEKMRRHAANKSAVS